MPSDDRFAASLRGFGPIGILAILVILAGNAVLIPLSALLVLLWMRLSSTPWHEIGYVRPKGWLRTIAVGIAFGVAFTFDLTAIAIIYWDLESMVAHLIFK